jgi:hypothetical protein
MSENAICVLDQVGKVEEVIEQPAITYNTPAPSNEEVRAVDSSLKLRLLVRLLQLVSPTERSVWTQTLPLR